MIDSPVRGDALAKLAESRAALLRLFEPPRDAAGAGSGAAGFPRSRIMRLLVSNRGLSAAAAVGGGFLLFRPGLLLRLARMIPVGALARAIFLKYLTKKRAPT